MFAIDNNGDLRIRDLTSLNSTEAHIVVMAKDSGVPPRMVSAGTSLLVDVLSKLCTQFSCTKM